MRHLSRRQFLTTSAAMGTLGAIPTLAIPRFAALAAQSTTIRAENRVIEVGGRPATVMGLVRPDGTHGLHLGAGAPFRVRLENQLDAPTLIHWHGLTPPYGQDGVPELPQPLLAAGQAYDYDFQVATPGTHWMHAHTLQEQQLLAAPLIVADATEAGLDEQPVVVLFHDFSFSSPEELLAGLTGKGGMAGHGSMPAMTGMQGQGMAGSMSMPGHDMSAMQGMGAMAGAQAMDINDIEYDAYLANDRTLDDPQVFRVDKGGTVRLRLINGATATAFWIDLGTLDGEAIAVDGNPIVSAAGRRFPLGMGQRIDIRIRLPRQEGAWPILALREGAAERTGFVLATKDGTIGRIAATGEGVTGPLDLALESGLRAARPLVDKAVDRRERVVLGGDMEAYVWTLNGRTWSDHQPLSVKAGERVEVTMRNDSMMGHPMHLHGHHFQVVAFDGRRIPGAVRDTVWVPPMRSLTVAFDADNPGTWAFHCHHLYHMATGMMTTVEYQA